MKTSTFFSVAIAAAATEASVLPRAAAAGGCPAVWTQITSDLTKLFVQSDGQCNDLARAAIRAVFHDCGTWAPSQGQTGGCDGSVFLSQEENSRAENRGLQTIAAQLKALAAMRQVGVADMIAFAGAHATLSCPLGPTCKTMIGRKDSSNAAPDESLLPAHANLTASQILPLMQDKGFSPADTAALVGAHSSSKQFFVQPALAGEPQDRTPGIWDVDFYSDTTTNPKGVFIFDSDKSLAADPSSGPTFKSFVGQQAQWNQAFADTFARLTLLGVNQAGLVDCTAALPPPRDSFPGANLPASAGASAAPSVAPSKASGIPKPSAPLSVPVSAPGIPKPSAPGLPKAPSNIPSLVPKASIPIPSPGEPFPTPSDRPGEGGRGGKPPKMI
ncbi:heme peroxidase [Microthyrium microscopicum]|uniref:Peroxidase n=1 Tax=Microthyrium microscopicum TaxID=703497 RepID=A0A6A6UFB6_9PEZI|nr:heme peroxidase [Microthyrium microscopicum]